MAEMPQVRNDVGGPVTGAVVQAHTVRDVHVYPETVRPVKPRQLPAPPRCFVGRTTERAMLTAALHATIDGADTLSIYAITGTGGIGKTSLAMSLAHQQVDLFPDGQLYVDLHGYDPLREPKSSSVALRGLLDSLGVDHVAIPADPEARAGLYRSLVSGKRMLIMLDNARDTDQVVPLLPGSAACTVIITSRDSLSGLIIARGAQQLRLDVLNNAEARGLLAARLGAKRLDAEPDAVNALLGLPRFDGQGR